MSSVLIVEEDAAMRALIGEWLEAAGYVVESISSATTSDVDLVILNIPNMLTEGAQTVFDARTNHPRAALIGISTQLGVSLRRTSSLAAAFGVDRLLAKPLAREELLSATADAIGAIR